ncbi:hypothetical protein REPUB_Repub02eG0100400 [Reevesia pubescens]
MVTRLVYGLMLGLRMLFSMKDFLEFMPLLSTKVGLSMNLTIGVTTCGIGIFNDSLIWKGNTNGNYSSKNFCSSVVADSGLKREVWKWLWVRNEVVFKGKLYNCSNMIEIIRIRVASWSKAKWPDCNYSFDDIFRTPKMLALSTCPKKPTTSLKWEPPPNGYLKFSVDGSSRSNPGHARIGGVLKDE